MPALSSRNRRQLLAIMTAVVAGLVVAVALRGKSLGPAASAVLQAAIVVISVYGGVVFIQEGNDKHVRSAACASVRRVLATYRALGQLGRVIVDLRTRLAQESEAGLIRQSTADLGLEMLAMQIETQLAPVDAAIRDWRDLAPAEVDEELNALRRERSADDQSH